MRYQHIYIFIISYRKLNPTVFEKENMNLILIQQHFIRQLFFLQQITTESFFHMHCNTSLSSTKWLSKNKSGLFVWKILFYYSVKYQYETTEMKSVSKHLHFHNKLSKTKPNSLRERKYESDIDTAEFY